MIRDGTSKLTIKSDFLEKKRVCGYVLKRFMAKSLSNQK